LLRASFAAHQLGAFFGQRSMLRLWAAMPEAAIHKKSDPLAPEND
jgi:hypothetical protein